MTRPYELPPLGENPSSTRQGTNPGSFARVPRVGTPWTFSSPDGPGMKSQAVFSDGAGMPGPSGELKVQGVPTRGARAKLPGFVPWRVEDGFSPRGGSS